MNDEQSEVFVFRLHLYDQPSDMIVKMYDSWLPMWLVGIVVVSVLIGVIVVDYSFVVPGGNDIDVVVVAPAICLHDTAVP